jgi:hypothetical protein
MALRLLLCAELRGVKRAGGFSGYNDIAKKSAGLHLLLLFKNLQSAASEGHHQMHSTSSTSCSSLSCQNWKFNVFWVFWLEAEIPSFFPQLFLLKVFFTPAGRNAAFLGPLRGYPWGVFVPREKRDSFSSRGRKEQILFFPGKKRALFSPPGRKASSNGKPAAISRSPSQLLAEDLGEGANGSRHILQKASLTELST